VLPFLPESAAQNEVVTRVMVDAALAYARGGYEVILDGVLGPQVRRDVLGSPWRGYPRPIEGNVWIIGPLSFGVRCSP